MRPVSWTGEVHNSNIVSTSILCCPVLHQKNAFLHANQATISTNKQNAYIWRKCINFYASKTWKIIENCIVASFVGKISASFSFPLLIRHVSWCFIHTAASKSPLGCVYWKSGWKGKKNHSSDGLPFLPQDEKQLSYCLEYSKPSSTQEGWKW